MFKVNQPSKYIQIISLILLISVSLAACSSSSSADAITDTTWQWVGLIETSPAAQSVVPDSENYTLLLGSDGSLSIKADCNMVGGSYVLDGSSLTIELGPTTTAFCGEESLDVQYLELLGNGESYSVENDQLVLELKDGAGRMLFEKE